VLPLVAQIPPPPFDGFSLGPLNVQMYGILIAIGAYLALRLAVRRYESYGGEPEVAERVALWSLGAGIVGARIGYVIPRFLENPSGTAFVDDPLAIIAIWEGGLAFFGGLFLGGFVGILLVRRWGADLPAMADAVAPAIPLAQAIGRWGNYFNQELYGTPTDLPWAVRIERADPRYPGVDTFHPTFLYESIGNLVLVGVLLLLERTGKLRRGALLWCYAIGYGLLRAVVESLRVDTDARYLGLSRNNWIAIATVMVATAGLIWWQQYGGRGRADDDAAGDDDPDDQVGAPAGEGSAGSLANTTGAVDADDGSEATTTAAAGATDAASDPAHGAVPSRRRRRRDDDTDDPGSAT
jgi:prolipoprotein diacylglyceryl transferase